MSDSAFDIAASGMAAHRAEIDIIAENLANAGTAAAGSATPYRARSAVFESARPDEAFSFADALSGALEFSPSFGFPANGDIAAGAEFASSGDATSYGVRLAGVVESDSPPQYRFDPSNPTAFASGKHRGFVAMPYVDPIEQMVSLVSAGRAYDGDVAALQAAKQMDVEAVDVDRA
jgi:flagellar basal-body rod protein FlgC